MRRIVSTIFIPFYIWIVFSVLRNRVPKILYRLGFGMLLHFLGVVYVFIVDTTGHALYQGNFLQESQILIFAACSHFQLITGLRFFRWVFMVGLIEQVATGTSPLRLGHHLLFTMS